MNTPETPIGGSLKPVGSASQHFREECFADRGYKFVRRDGEDAIWQHNGFFKHMVRIKLNGDVEDEPNARGQARRDGDKLC